MDGFLCRVGGGPKLLGVIPYGEFQFEELDETQQLSGDETPPGDPAAGEVLKGVAARGTTTPSKGPSYRWCKKGIRHQTKWRACEDSNLGPAA